MARVLGARLPARRRVLVYVVGSGLWLTGGLWLVFHHFLQRRGELGIGPHPLEPWWMKFHGAFALGALWVLGLLWGVHVVEGWALRKRRVSGAVLLGTLGLLTVTGYLLYYVGDEQAREVTGIVHWAVGLACAVVFIVHRFALWSLRRGRGGTPAA